MFSNYLLLWLLWLLLWLLWLLWLNQPLGLAIQKLGAVVQVGVIAGITGILRVGFVRKKRDLVGLVAIHVLPRITASICGCAQPLGRLSIVGGCSRYTHGVRRAGCGGCRGARSARC